MNHWKKINEMLDEANNFHPNIKLVRQLGVSVPFLDVFIENKNGTLVTYVHHKEAAEPYLVPFKSDHPRHVFANIIDGGLIRAIRYSSTLALFNQEQRFIKLMLLYNGLVLPISFLFIQHLFLFLQQLSTKVHLQSIHEIFYKPNQSIINFTFHRN
jgi:hypothetical protein